MEEPVIRPDSDQAAAHPVSRVSGLVRYRSSRRLADLVPAGRLGVEELEVEEAAQSSSPLLRRLCAMGQSTPAGAPHTAPLAAQAREGPSDS